MNKEQLRFVRALLALAIEIERVLSMDEWLGDESFENWTKEDTIELDKLMEEVKT